MKNDTLYTKKWLISKLVMKVALPMRYKKLLKLYNTEKDNGRHTRICIPNYMRIHNVRIACLSLRIIMRIHYLYW